MKNATKRGGFVNLILLISGFVLCIVPPAICTLTYFPIWRMSGYASCIAGGTALIITVCFLPLYKFISRVIRSYSSYVMWLCLFLLFFALSKIAEQMTVISLVGFVGNLLGEVCFRLARGGEPCEE